MAQILRSMRLFSTETLVAQAAEPVPFALDERRQANFKLLLADGGIVTVRDQKPLASGHIDFDTGWDVQLLTRRLNRLVFLWPGTSGGPVPSGLRHADRYARDGEALWFLRLPAESVLTEARGLFALVNSGSLGLSMG